MKGAFSKKNWDTEQIKNNYNEIKKEAPHLFNNESDYSAVFYNEAISSKNINNLKALKELNISLTAPLPTLSDMILRILPYPDRKYFIQVLSDLGLFDEQYVKKSSEHSGCLISYLLYEHKEDVVQELINNGYPKKIYGCNNYISVLLELNKYEEISEFLKQDFEYDFNDLVIQLMFTHPNKSIEKNGFFDISNKILNAAINSKNCSKDTVNDLKTAIFLNLLSQESIGLNFDYEQIFLNTFGSFAYTPFLLKLCHEKTNVFQQIAFSEKIELFLKNEIKENTNEIATSLAKWAIHSDYDLSVYPIISDALKLSQKEIATSIINKNNKVLINSFVGMHKNSYEFLKKYSDIDNLEYKGNITSLARIFNHSMSFEANSKKFLKESEDFLIEHVIKNNKFNLNKEEIGLVLYDDVIIEVDLFYLAVSFGNKKLLNSLINDSNSNFNFDKSFTNFIYNKLHEQYSFDNVKGEQFKKEIERNIKLISKYKNLILKHDDIVSIYENIIETNDPDESYHKELNLLLNIQIEKNLLQNSINKKKQPQINIPDRKRL